MKCISLRQWTKSFKTDFIILYIQTVCLYNRFELVTRFIQIEFLVFFGKKHEFCQLSLKNILFPRKQVTNN